MYSCISTKVRKMINVSYSNSPIQYQRSLLRDVNLKVKGTLKHAKVHSKVLIYPYV